MGTLVACSVAVWGLTTAARGSEPVVIPPAVLESPPAIYPEDASRDGVSGTVVLDVELDVDGRVSKVTVASSPDPRLGWSAMAAMTNTAFHPARIQHSDGMERPTPVRFRHVVVFDLPQQSNTLDINNDQPSMPRPGLVVGAIHAAGDDDVVAGAHLHVRRDGREMIVNGAPIAVVSDGQGGFALPPLPPGPVELLVDAPGYVGARVVLMVVEDGTEDILVHLERIPSGSRETIVMGRKTGEVVRRTLTQSVAMIDSATLARVRGRGLADTVADLPGVSMVQTGPQQAKPVVRGLFGRRLVMLTDGVRHESQDWGIDHAPEIDPHAAGQITVVKGAAGVRYGADAIGGVILVEPPPLRLDPGMAGEIFVGAVDNGLRGEVGGRVDIVLPQVPELSLRLEGNSQRGAAVSSPGYVLGNTTSAIGNVGATVAYRTFVLERALTATLTFRHHESELGICYCLKVATPEALRDRLEAGPPPGADQWTTSYDVDRPRQHVRHTLVLARTDLDLDVGRVQTTWASQFDDRDEFDQARRAVEGPQYSFVLASHAVEAVFIQRRQRFGRFALHGQFGARGDLQLHAYEGLQLIPNYRRFSGGVFALERLVMEDFGGIGDLEFVAGARTDGLLQTSILNERAWRTQVRRGRLSVGECDVGDDAARCEKRLPAASMTIGTRLTLPLSMMEGPHHNTLTLQADLSTATRFPDVDELYLGGPAPSFPVFGLGDAGLGTERTWQLSIGAMLQTDWLKIEAGAFASRINDFIAFGPELGPEGRPVVDVIITGAYPRFSSRAVEAMMSGADGGAVLFPDEVMSVAVQAAMVRGLDLDSGGFLPFMPPDQVRAEVRLQPDRWLILLSPTFATHVTQTRVATGLIGMAKQERSDARSDFAPPPTGWMLWNASASAEVGVLGLPVLVGVEGRNLLNTPYRDAMSLMRFFADQPGRELWLRLSMRFDDVFSSHDHRSHETLR